MAPPRKYNMTPSAREFRALMAANDLATEADVCEFIGCSLRSARNYANGEPIPEPVIRLMRAKARYPKIDLEVLLQPYK